MKKILSFATMASLFVGAVALAGCSSVSDTTDGGTDGGTDTYVAPDSSGDTSSETGPTCTDAPDYSTDPGKTLLRVVVATDELDPSTGFDLCYDQGSTGVFKGPIAYKNVGTDKYFTAPSVTKFFEVTGIATGQPVSIRIVKPGSSCDMGARFKVKGTGLDLVVKDDKTNTIVAGYNTLVISGSIGTDTTGTLNALLTADPTPKPTAPTLQFFQGLKGLSLKLALFDEKGTEYSLSGSTDIAYQANILIPFGTSYASPVSIAKITFSAGSSSFTFSPSDFASTVCNGYYWMIAYGSPTSPKAYVCKPSNEVGTAGGGIEQSNCFLYSAS